MTRSEFLKAIGLTALSLGVFKLVGDRDSEMDAEMRQCKDPEYFYKTYWRIHEKPKRDFVGFYPNPEYEKIARNYVEWEGKIYKLTGHRP